MNRTMHVRTPPPRRDAQLADGQMGYAAALSARVAELRSRLHAEFTSQIQTSSEQRRARLNHLMGELHSRMASESCLRAQLELARAAQRQSECAERRACLEKTLAESAEIRHCPTRAGQSTRRPRAPRWPRVPWSLPCRRPVRHHRRLRPPPPRRGLSTYPCCT